MGLWALTNRWCFIGAAPSINPSVLPKFVMKIPSYKCRVLQHFADMELFVKYIDRTTNHSSNIHHWIRFIQYLQTISKLLHYGLMGSYSMVLSWSSTIYSSRCPSYNMALWTLTNRWCFIGATPSINPSILLLQLWSYGLLRIDGALLTIHYMHHEFL